MQDYKKSFAYKETRRARYVRFTTEKADEADECIRRSR